MTSCAWMWMYAGAALMLLELLAPGFVMFFFGLAAASTGLCRFVFGDVFTPAWQFIAFSVFTILYLAFVRRWLKTVFNGATSVSNGVELEFVGREACVTEPIAPPADGRVMLGDAEWKAHCDVPVAAGEKVRVVGQDNLTLKVEKLG